MPCNHIELTTTATWKSVSSCTPHKLSGTKWLSSSSHVRQTVTNPLTFVGKDSMNIGKFSRFCHDFEIKLPKRKITEIYNQVIHKHAPTSRCFCKCVDGQKCTQLNFGLFYQALQRIATEESQFQIDELVQKLKRLKVQLAESADKAKKKIENEIKQNKLVLSQLK